MEIYLVRHTRVRNDHNICYGHFEVPLADSFMEEASKVKALVPNGVVEYYCSPSTRCLKLAMELDLMPVIDARLREMNFGDWEGKAWNELPSEELDPWMNDFVNIAPPNGESLIDLFTRVQSFYNEIKDRGKPAVIFTHAGVIRCFYALLGKVALKDIFQVKVDHGSMHRLEG